MPFECNPGVTGNSGELEGRTVKSDRSSFFEGLARHCASHPWRVVIIWVMLLAIALTLFLTIFSKNMTTAIQFTTDTDSKKSENLFKEKFPMAAWKQENCVITSNTCTADDPEFWAYVDGLWAKLGELRGKGIVKDVQYYDPVLRNGVPLVPPVLEEMIAGLQLILGDNTTSAQLIAASDGLKASGARLQAAANAFPADSVTLNGKMGLDGMRQGADGAAEIAGLLLLYDGLQKTYNALLPVTQGAVLTPEVREATVADMKATAVRLSDMAAYLEATGPGTADRATLVSGLKQFGQQGPMLAAMYEAKYAAQLGRDFAVMLTSDNLPSAAAVNAVVVDMQATAERLSATITYVEQTVPESETRQTLLDGLNSAASQMDQYGNTVMPYLALALQYIEDPESGFWGDAAESILKTGLGLAQGYMGQQIATAEAGLLQMQEQTGAQIGQVSDGIATLHGQISTQLPTAIEGLAAAKDGMVQAAGLVSTDQRTALFVINLSENADEAAKHILEVRDAVLTGDGIGIEEETSFVDGFRVRMVGSTNVSRDMQDVAFRDLTKSLMVAVPIALVVLLFVFGTLGSAMLPIVLSLVSIMVALGIAAVLGTWIKLNFAIENVVFMLGLALGIDHALFFAYRYREERRKGHDKIEAIARSGSTASHAIFYAGIIVAIALFGILMIPCNMHMSLAMGAIIVVAVLTPASMTLVPAVLSLIGNGVDFGRLPWQKRITDIEKPGTTPQARGFWHWVTLPAMRAPIVSFILAAAIAVVCVWPVSHMKLSYSYVDTLPPSCVSRSGYDAMMAAGYPNLLVAPLEIGIDGYDQPAVRAEAEKLIDDLEADGGFVTAVPLSVNEEGNVAWKRVFLNMDPFTADASDKVKQLRNDYIGDRFEDVGGAAHVSGYGAFNNDFIAATDSRLIPVLALVMGLSLLLMLVAFRSVLLAVILTAFNALSVYGGYGLVVWAFQDGNIPFFAKISGIDSYVPIFLLCGLFGISMDYFVFMVSRVRERYDQTANMSEAITFAFRRSGLVVLGAAAIMLVVFFAFSRSQIVVVAELGFGLVASIVIDATLITLIMSPASMRILGKWFWWWPKSLSWVPDLRARPPEEVET